MRNLFHATFALFTAFAFTAGIGQACELNRGTVFSADSPFYGEMVVMCGSDVLATRDDLNAAGVDIFNPDEVLAFLTMVEPEAELPYIGGGASSKRVQTDLQAVANGSGGTDFQLNGVTVATVDSGGNFTNSAAGAVFYDAASNTAVFESEGKGEPATW